MGKRHYKLLKQIAFNTILAGGLSDTTAPSVTDFAATTPVIGTTVTITAFTASEAGVSFLITETSDKPAAGAPGWSASAPTTFAASGSATLWPWVKDAEGNVSSVYGSPVAVVCYENPAYANAKGTGDRRSTITVTSTFLWGIGDPTKMVDGDLLNGYDWSEHGSPIAGKTLTYMFDALKLVTEITHYIYVTDTDTGTMKPQATSNGSDWFDFGPNFVMGDVTPVQTIVPQVIAVTGTPAILGVRFIGVSGLINNGVFHVETQLKIGNQL